MKSCKFFFLALLLLGGIQGLPAQGMEENSATEAEEFVPQWAKKAIWYQIFPERFANGDRKNDPKVADIKGADPQDPPKYWKVHPWGSDWYELQGYEQKNGEPELWKHLLRRRYGGDLQGILDRLDYLEDLGINAIYLNPVFDAPSLHKYDGASYHHIDPNFGPDPKGDRALMAKEVPHDPKTWVWTKADKLALKLIEELHKRDIRVIFDGVFNHMGVNSFAWKDVVNRQQKSVYKDWFMVNSWWDPKKGTTFQYDGWWGVKSLPELKEDEKGMAKGPKDYIFAATERWMNPMGKGPEYGIDGWRLDVAFCVGHPFWKQWRKHVKKLNPEAYLTAEIVDVPEKVTPYMQGDEFDTEMNYNFAFCLAEYFLYPDSMRISSTEFARKLKDLRELYPKGVAEVSQTLLGSHDTNRISSLIKNRGIGSFRDWGTYFSLSKVIDNPNYSPRKPTKEDYELLKLLVIFQMTYPGAPMIYYGDEVGMWGANDPDCRKPMVWADQKYEAETHFPDQSTHEADEVAFNEDLFTHYKNLILVRNSLSALQDGTYEPFMANDRDDAFGFIRENEEMRVLVVFNNSDIELELRLPDEWKGAAAVMTDTRWDGRTVAQISPKWAGIMLKRKNIRKRN